MNIYLASSTFYEFKRLAFQWPPPATSPLWQHAKACLSPPAKMHILMSFHYTRKEDLDLRIPAVFPHSPPYFFADSGAFSAWSQGASITLKEYGAWLSRWKHWITHAANLDVIGDPQATWANQCALEDMGHAVLPVFHTGESWDILERLAERYPYVALGGMVPYVKRKRLLMPWLTRCFRIAEGRSVFHGFGLSTWEILRQFPWRSVDSTSWLHGRISHRVSLFHTKHCIINNYELNNPKQRHALLSAIKPYGINTLKLIASNHIDPNDLIVLSGTSFLLAAGWLTYQARPASEEPPCIVSSS